MSDALYDPGTTIRLTGHFRALGVLTDPSTVTLKVKDPAGVTTNYTYAATVVKDSTGVYHYDLTPSTPGRWFYRWVATGTVAVSGEESFRVRNPEIP